MSIGDIVDRHRLVVTVGTGGVGKTTLAAALALGGALRGRRAMVLTIDPARALARALGLTTLERGGQRIDATTLRAAGIELAGSFDAGMLDQKSAWDGFIERHAPSDAVRRALLDNPFYQELSQRFAGATEFVAMEELCRLHESARYDLIILDTPPAAHALDFVTAPERIDRLLDPEIASWLSHPTVRAGRAASATLGVVMRLLARATGKQTLRDVAAFFAALDTLFDDLRRRARTARELIHGPEAAFVLVTGADEAVLEATAELDARIRALHLPLRGVIANRMRAAPGALEPHAETLAGAVLERLALDAPVHDWLDHTCREAFALARLEEQRWRAVVDQLPANTEHATVAELDHDLCSIADLATVGRRFWNA